MKPGGGGEWAGQPPLHEPNPRPAEEYRTPPYHHMSNGNPSPQVWMMFIFNILTLCKRSLKVDHSQKVGIKDVHFLKNLKKFIIHFI